MAKLPHLRNVYSYNDGSGPWDPVNVAVFEVEFDLPEAIRSEFAGDIPILSQQVTDISGIDGLQMNPGVGEQKFYGVTSSFLNPMLDTTAIDVTMNLNLNLRNVSDNFVFRIFKAWQKRNHDLQTGTRRLMKDYIADGIKIRQANRDGTVWREVTLHKVILTGISNFDSLDYTNNEAVKLQVTFRCDFWDEDIAGDINPSVSNIF